MGLSFAKFYINSEEKPVETDATYSYYDNGVPVIYQPKIQRTWVEILYGYK